MLNSCQPSLRSQPTVTLIIINWNSGDWLKKCLQGVAEQTIQPQRVLLIDNASTDSSLDDIESYFPSVEIIRQKENLGFARGNNAALKLIDTQWTVLLNPDAIPESDWLGNLLSAAEHNPEYSFFASKMIDALQPSFFDGAGDLLHISGLGWRRFHGLPVKSIQDLEMECFGACAGAAMYRTDAFKEAGGFDEDFFCYFEDIDLSFRLRLAGHRCFFVPNAVVAHVGSVTTGGKQSDFSVYHGHRNLVWTYVKNMPGWLFWACLPLHLLMNLVTVLMYVWRGQGGVILRAKRDALSGLPKMWKKRREIQKRRKVSVSEIWRVLDKRMLFGRKSR